jgi:hypothetical protein
MNLLDSDPTSSFTWQVEQTDRLLGWEVLQQVISAKEQQTVEPGVLADKVGIHKGYPHQIIEKLRNAAKR